MHQQEDTVSPILCSEIPPAQLNFQGLFKLLKTQPFGNFDFHRHVGIRRLCADPDVRFFFISNVWLALDRKRASLLQAKSVCNPVLNTYFARKSLQRQSLSKVPMQQVVLNVFKPAKQHGP